MKNYENIDITHLTNKMGKPGKEKMKEATTGERRAYLYNIYKENGYFPNQQRTYAKYFDVNQSVISRDIKRITKYILDNTDWDKAKTDIDLFADTVKEKLMENGESYKAWKVLSDKAKILQDLGKIEKAPERVEVDIGENNVEKALEEIDKELENVDLEEDENVSDLTIEQVREKM